MKFLDRRTIIADNKIAKAQSEGRVTCSCGQRTTISAQHSRRLCSNCGNYVYNNSIARFRYEYYKAKENLNGYSIDCTIDDNSNTANTISCVNHNNC